MKLANRCPRCGGTANHFVTDIMGKLYYRCMTGLTSLRNQGGEIVGTGNILACETVIDSDGKVVTGTIAYNTGGNTKTLGVTEGKIRR